MELSHQFDSAASGNPGNPLSPPSFDGMVAKLARERDVVIIGDTNHLDRDFHAPLHEESLYATAKDNGVTKLHLEFSQELQGDLNDMLKGKISRDDFLDGIIDKYKHERSLLSGFKHSELDFSDGSFREKMGDFADMAITAHKAGLKVIAADPQSIHDVVVWSEVSNKNGPNYNEDAIKDFLKKRFSEDVEIAKDIAGQRGGKSLVIYGGYHILPDVRHSLDDALAVEGKTSGVIMMTGGDPSADLSDLQAMKRDGDRVDIPNYIYNPYTGESVARQGAITPVTKERGLDASFIQ